VELLTEVKALISTYSYDEAMKLLEVFLKEKTAMSNEKISEEKYREIKEAFSLLFHIIELKDDESLKNKTSLSKILFLSKSSSIEEAIENIKEIESYLDRTNKQYGLVVNILWQAFYKIGELEKATIFASKYLNELLKYKHFCLYEKSCKEMENLGIKAERSLNENLKSGIRLESHLAKCVGSIKSLANKDLINYLYELLLFFNDERILLALSDLAVEKQEKILLLAIEKFAKEKKIKNKNIESNINRYSNFPDRSSIKNSENYDFADDLFAKEKEKVSKTQKPKEHVEFNVVEKLIYLNNEDIKTEKDLLNLDHNEQNFLELAAFLIELGLNRKAVKVLEKYIVLNLPKEKLRDLYYLYIKALLLSKEKSLAKKIFNDFCMNSSLSSQEQESLQILFKELGTESR
jgi:hypothetical protein